MSEVIERTETSAVQAGWKSPRYETRADLLARVEAKRAAVLAWLGAEIFSSAAILGQVMGLKKSGTYQTLAAMKRDGLIEFQSMEWHAGSMQIVVLTPHGAALAGDGGDGFQQGKVAPSSIAHQLDVQKARLYLEAAGSTGWVSEFSLRRKKAEEERLEVPEMERKWRKVPDAVYVSRSGRRVAIEMERTIKTTRNYRGIVGEYLHMIELGQTEDELGRKSEERVEQVVYITTSDRVRDALRAKVKGMTEVRKPVGLAPGGGRKLEFESYPWDEADKDRFFFFSMEDLKTMACRSHQEGSAD